MREYELTVVYDLAVAEAGGPEAGPERLTSLVEARGGKMLKIDHWGRRRMAYPINRALDGDYIVTRIDFEPTEVAGLEAALKIDEKVYRYLTVRADELPPPPPPREPREPRPAPAAEASTAPAEVAAPAAPAAEQPASEPKAEAPAPDTTEAKAEAPAVAEAKAEEPAAATEAAPEADDDSKAEEPPAES
ncbi:MAG: 30S ribosomal protein S6 [Dehalococcoidia bacterium]